MMVCIINGAAHKEGYDIWHSMIIFMRMTTRCIDGAQVFSALAHMKYLLGRFAFGKARLFQARRTDWEEQGCV